MKDMNGHEYAKLSQVKAGDVLEIDNGFDCHVGGKVTVYADEDGGLYFACHDGKHFLDGQIAGEYLMGMYQLAR